MSTGNYEKGKLLIRKTKKGKIEKKVKIGDKQPIPIPYEYEVDESWNEREVLVEREKGVVIKVLTTDGKELPKSQETLQNKSPNSYRSKGNSFKQKGEKGNKGKRGFPDSFILVMSQVPSDTRNTGLKDVDNFYLKFFQFARWSEEKGKDQVKLKFKFFHKSRDGDNFQIRPQFDMGLLSRMLSNIEEIVNAFKQLNYQVIDKTFSPEWRMVIGLGNPSVYEVSMTLHFTYGIPYIPASAIKGVIRNALIRELFLTPMIKDNTAIDEKLGSEAEKKAQKDPLFDLIFGNPKESSCFNEARKGKVIFLDAYPIESPMLKIDIMNSHYPQYYTGNNPPSDWQDPNPIYFLTVEKTKFRFIILIHPGILEGLNKVDLMDKSELWSRYKEGKKDIKIEDIKDVIEKSLIDSVKNHGIGAKTSVGYGYLIE